MQDYPCTTGSNWLPVHTGLFNALECGHLGIESLQFFDSFGIDPFTASGMLTLGAVLTTSGASIRYYKFDLI